MQVLLYGLETIKSQSFVFALHCYIQPSGVVLWKMATVFTYFTIFIYFSHNSTASLLLSSAHSTTIYPFVCSRSLFYHIFFSLALLFHSPTFNHSVFVSKNFSHEEKPIKFYILPFYYISFRFPKHHFKLAILWVILDLLIHIQISLNPFMTVNSGVD